MYAWLVFDGFFATKKMLSRNDRRRNMTSYERVLATVNHETPDRTPCDLRAVEEVVQGLVTFMGKSNAEEVYQDLGLDFRHFRASISKKQPVPDREWNEYEKSGTLVTSPYGVVSVQHKNFPQAHRVYGPFYDNRDLDSFDVDLKTTMELASLVPENRIIVSESGIRNGRDIRLLKGSKVHAVLVGTALMKNENVSSKAKELVRAGMREDGKG